MAKRGNPNMRQGSPSLNPNGRRGKSPPTSTSSGAGVRVDGWGSVMSGIGNATYDKRESATHSTCHVSRQQALSLMESDDIAQKAVNIPIEDAVRQGYDFEVKDVANAKDLQDKIVKRWSELQLLEKIGEGLYYEGSQGGSAVLIGVQDNANEDWSTELEIDKVRSLDFLNVLEPHECTPKYWYNNPRKPNYGKVSHYDVFPFASASKPEEGSSVPTFVVHESRLLVFPGIRPTKEQRATEHGWGSSTLTAMYSVLRDFNMSWASAAVLLQEASIKWMQIENLSDLLGSKEGQALLRSRMLTNNQTQSVARTTMIGENETMGRLNVSLGGVEGLLREFMARMASAAGSMPVTKLFGTSPGGLNSSGTSDIDQWDDRVRSLQDKKWVPHIKKISEILLSIEGQSPESWNVTPRPLRQQTDKEIADTRKVVAETDAIYAGLSAIGPDEIRESRWGGDAYSIETVIDLSIDAASLEDAEAEKQAAQEMQAEALKQGNAQGQPNAKPVPNDPGREVEK